MYECNKCKKIISVIGIVLVLFMYSFKSFCGITSVEDIEKTMQEYVEVTDKISRYISNNIPSPENANSKQIEIVNNFFNDANRLTDEIGEALKNPLLPASSYESRWNSLKSKFERDYKNAANNNTSSIKSDSSIKKKEKKKKKHIKAPQEAINNAREDAFTAGSAGVINNKYNENITNYNEGFHITSVYGFGIVPRGYAIAIDELGQPYQIVSSWIQDNLGEWVYIGDDGWAVEGIQMIDGKKYYFYKTTEENMFRMATNTVAEGYRIGADGVLK